LFSLPAVEGNGVWVAKSPKLAKIAERRQAEILRVISDRNARFFDMEATKLNGWADDQIGSAERALAETKRRIRELRNQANKAATMEERARIQTDIRDSERKQRKLRQEIFDVEDKILAQRDELIEGIKSKLNSTVTSHPLFTVRWVLTGTASRH
jgi:hypothetical protein